MHLAKHDEAFAGDSGNLKAWIPELESTGSMLEIAPAPGLRAEFRGPLPRESYFLKVFVWSFLCVCARVFLSLVLLRFHRCSFSQVFLYDNPEPYALNVKT